ncbi:DUF502 domain-containing protein [Rhodobacter ferrooxidans]|uniref:DUF502 domain-containing protein n=1 Tax=Rhodobacter ferrooxidans TaxID=371731 RepID=C8RZ48_9RHOB|nr:DUF502 domain-containing protein [Rhodobacter sp. SW2]EEW26005.1 protein of unknown function DUF502 [Rhodobacter sp. SW2]
MTDLPPPLAHKRRGLLGGLRASFLTGLVVVLPVGLTIYLIWTVIGMIDSWILPLVPGPYQPDALMRRFFGPDYEFPVRGVGVVVFLVFTAVVGWIAKGLIGRSLIGWAEGLVDRMPVVRSIYNGLKQIAETVFAQSETNFDKACLVEFPRQGIWAIGFVATKARDELAQKIPVDGDVLTVFVATTPNPTSGFLVYVPADRVIMLDMSLEDAAKLIISAGLVYPNPKDPSQPVLTAA